MVNKSSRAEKMRARDARQVTEALKGAVQTMEAADYGMRLWADDVRQQAEERLGLTAGDEMALDDEEYDAALALTGDVITALAAVKAVASAFSHIAEQHVQEQIRR